MKFNCGGFRRYLRDLRNDRLERLSKRHKWFAWHPVKIHYDDCRWLEYVEREARCWKPKRFGQIEFLYWRYRDLP